MISDILTFLSGVTASLIATWISHVVIQRRKRGLARKLEGYWVEKILNSERPVSLCRLTYKPRSKEYVYTGSSYFASGEDYCDFESESVTFDWKARRMFYIYKFWRKGEIGNQTYGYGWLTIEEDAELITFTDGHYRSSEPDSVARHSRMVRLSEACKAVGMVCVDRPNATWRTELVKKYSALITK